MKIPNNSLNALKNKKNLLAFSGGVDSSALFFILMENDIDFDIAVVDYQTRVQSKKEVAYAKELSKRYKKRLFLKEAKIKSSNFEHGARNIRYSFFEKIIKDEDYNNLITAHQLNDKLEWFFMQLSKGAGVVELLGFKEVENREKYTLVRPIIDISKDELQDFLNYKKIKHFVDESNFDENIKRNYIRANFSNKFLSKYKKGVLNSFKYLQNDKNILDKTEILFQENDLFILKDFKEDTANLRQIDKIVKKLGYLLSKKQKDEILKTKNIVISDKIAVVFSEDKIYIAPFEKAVMDKKFKEKCRIKKIPSKIRPYIYLFSLYLFKNLDQ